MRYLLLALLLLAPVAVHAQLPPWYNPYGYPRPYNPYVPQKPSVLTVGGFFSLGLESHDTKTQTSPALVPLVGLFADYGRHTVRPGIDLRGQGGVNGVSGTLVGPRVSAQYSILRPYAAALFGPNHYQEYPAQTTAPGTTSPNSDVHGVTVKAAFGVDVDYSPHISWRMIEYTVGTFHGLPDSHPQTFSTGIVFRVP